MSNDPNRPFVHLLPALLTGAAALIASLTAVYVNVRHDRAAEKAPTAAVAASVIAAPATAARAPVPTPTPKPPERYALQLDRIAVRHDGASLGSADWRFTVEADDEPLLAFVSDGLDDSGGHNVVLPKDVGSAVRIASTRGSRIVVKAWHSRRFRLGEGEPDAGGEGVLDADGNIAPLRVAADEPARGEFVFYFSAIPDTR